MQCPTKEHRLALGLLKNITDRLKWRKLLEGKVPSISELKIKVFFFCYTTNHRAYEKVKFLEKF